MNLAKAHFPTRRTLVTLILAISILGLFFGTQVVSAASGGSIKLWDAVASYSTGPTTSPALATVEASKSVTLDFSAGDTAILSSTADGLGNIRTDNFITVNGVNVCNGFVFDSIFHCFTGGSISPIDISSNIPIGETTILIEWRDYGGTAESTDIFLVTDAEILELICHVPPGKPAREHEKLVGQKAAEKHLAKHEGDRRGPC